jgi:FG-GAP-like repeat
MRWALALVLATGTAQAERVPVSEGDVAWATLAQPTDRYDHAVLGDALEWGGLVLSVNTCIGCAGLHLTDVEITLPPQRVFEDVEARTADLDGDGRDEVVVVESDLSLGASLAVYGPKGKIAATDFIGEPHRWLAPAGIADFDGDGRVEIAYVDRPHLLAELVFVRLQGDRLVETLRLPGLTNHRIGDAVISGGVRDCGSGPDLILASKDWTRVMRVRGGKVADLGPLPPEGLTIPPC